MKTIKKLIKLISLTIILTSCQEKALKEKVTKKVKIEYSIGEDLMRRLPVKKCSLEKGVLTVIMNDVLTFQTSNPALICIKQKL